MRIKTLPVAIGREFDLSRFPNFHVSGSVAGMKKLYYGEDCLLVRCGSFIYNVDSAPEIYWNLSH
jgi:hypothetical protein